MTPADARYGAPRRAHAWHLLGGGAGMELWVCEACGREATGGWWLLDLLARLFPGTRFGCRAERRERTPGICDMCCERKDVATYDDGHDFVAVCKSCDDAMREAWDALTPEQQEEALRDA